MKVLAHNTNHDGCVAYVEDGEIKFNLESEKDNHRRHSLLTPSLLLSAMEAAGAPDVVATSGWGKVNRSDSSIFESAYLGFGTEAKLSRTGRLGGRQVERFSSSHERSHVMCGYGLAPFPQGEPCYVLVWEGSLGAFYRIDHQVGIHKIGDVLKQPGGRYAYPFALADPNFPKPSGLPRHSDAGKLMALVSFGKEERAGAEARRLSHEILTAPDIYATSLKERHSRTRFCNMGHESQEFRDLAKFLSDALFDQFYQFAKEHLTDRLPLIIVGGCGLNCDWNSRWKTSGLFSDVFVPPCTNDSGISIGAAIDALHHYTDVAKVKWNVYCGDYFVEDEADCTGFERRELVLGDVCAQLLAGRVVAWVQGRYEMGPRALGNRSLLASPFFTGSRDLLNHIKRRETYRPIAPICREEDFDIHFENHGPSPHMLYFQRVKSKALAAITHVDGSARAQTVTKEQNPRMHALLSEFQIRSKYGVLCNTSLNFPGQGFINRLSDLVVYASQAGIDGFVVGDSFWIKKQSATNVL